MTNYTTLPADDLAMEQERLREQLAWFLRAERSYRDPKESARRRECEIKLLAIKTEFKRRKSLARDIKANINYKHGLVK